MQILKVDGFVSLCPMLSFVKFNITTLIFYEINSTIICLVYAGELQLCKRIMRGTMRMSAKKRFFFNFPYFSHPKFGKKIKAAL